MEQDTHTHTHTHTRWSRRNTVKEKSCETQTQAYTCSRTAPRDSIKKSKPETIIHMQRAYNGKKKCPEKIWDIQHQRCHCGVFFYIVINILTLYPDRSLPPSSLHILLHAEASLKMLSKALVYKYCKMCQGINLLLHPLSSTEILSISLYELVQGSVCTCSCSLKENFNFNLSNL